MGEYKQGRPKLNVSEEEKQAIIEAYFSGMAQKKMEKQFHHSMFWMKQMMADMGLTDPPKPKRKRPRKTKSVWFTKKDSICWHCKRSSAKPGDQCSWTCNFQPVKGWDAVPTICDRHSHGVMSHSYNVRHCPLYIREEKFLVRGIEVFDDMP